MYYQKEIYTPDATVLNLRTQLNWTQENCAKHFEINVRTWQRWEKENKLSPAGREFLFLKVGYLTSNRRNLFFGSKYIVEASEVTKGNFEFILMKNGEKLYESNPFIISNLKIWLERKNNENTELREALTKVKQLKKSSLLTASNDMYIDLDLQTSKP